MLKRERSEKKTIKVFSIFNVSFAIFQVGGKNEAQWRYGLEKGSIFPQDFFSIR